MPYIKQRVKLFQGEDVSAVATYKYVMENDSSMGVADTSGEVNVSDAEKLEFAYRCSALNASCINLRLEGRFEQNDTWGVVATFTLTATDPLYSFYTVTNQLKRVRAGAKAGNTATPNNLYCDLLVVE